MSAEQTWREIGNEIDWLEKIKAGCLRLGRIEKAQEVEKKIAAAEARQQALSLQYVIENMSDILVEAPEVFHFFVTA